MTHPFPAYPDLELHNIAELDHDSGYPGALVRRIPRAIAAALERGSMVSQEAQLCELRFVVESGKRLAILLTAPNGGDLFVYRGEFVHSHIRLPTGRLYRHLIDYENDPFAVLRPEAFAGQTFDRRVWRVMFDGLTILHGVDRMDSTIRPLRPGEKPGLRWLAYGSSITHGFTAVTRRQCYAAQTAHRLGVDVLNLGLSGSCVIEPGFADYLTGRDDWDFITCELGVNMRGQFTPEVFAARARYLVEALTSRRPGRPVVLISPFTGADDYRAEPIPASLHTAGYRVVLRDLAAEFADRQVHFIEGTDLLPTFSGLTCDLGHPSTEGHTAIAEHLADRLRALGIV
ncbi:MAG: GDSL-type esterase/lipase family protein [Kiritimatiellae bacterium]|nr:GDSL-type esterase/lipase family protein [Kiritimatiellia bacterium]